MAMDTLCYYLVPAGIGAFGLFMAVFLRKTVRDCPSRFERELKELKINAEIKS